ncbi:MAG: hypothetical protein WD887_02995 [Candidatus Saccharimonadales bacterium]
MPTLANKDKIILDLCGGTGSWSKPYVEAGYDVQLITLPHNDVREYEPPENVYGILAAPPCTMFSIARKTTAKQPRSFAQGLEIVLACLRIVWDTQGNGETTNLKFWCLENPRGYLRHFLGLPALTVRQSEYGAAINKPTDLWGYFKPPKPTHPGRKVTEAEGDLIWQRMKSPQPGLTRADMRAVTPPGFAYAFYKSNQ